DLRWSAVENSKGTCRSSAQAHRDLVPYGHNRWSPQIHDRSVARPVPSSPSLGDSPRFDSPPTRWYGVSLDTDRAGSSTEVLGIPQTARLDSPHRVLRFVQPCL